MAAEAVLATRGRLPGQPAVRLRGRGGVGSIHLDGWLEANRDRLAADVAIISDTGFFEGNLPAITRRPARDHVRADRRRRDRRVDLHSGSYGGAVQNPANALAQIIAALKGPRRPDPHPRASTTTSRALTDAERADVRGAAVRRGRRTATGLGVPALVGEAGLHDARAARRPADARRQRHLGRLPGRGLQDDHPGPRPRQGQLPARRRPGPGGDLRAVPGLRAGGRAARRHGQRAGPRTAGAHRSPRSTTRRRRPRRGRSRRRSGRPPLYIREGGSIPVAASFESILGLPVVLLGFTPPNDNAHAPNESMSRCANYETAHPDGHRGRGTRLGRRRPADPVADYGRSGWVNSGPSGC